jgi:hypothetical protein
MFSLLVSIVVLTHAQTPAPTISGLSSGGFMAAQMHVAHSQSIKGVGILAGGPYGCADGQVNKALFSCMSTFLGVPDGAALFAEAIGRSEKGEIDPVSELSDSRVVLVTGENDTVVRPVVVYENLSFYATVKRKAIKVIDELPIGHAFPTVDKGNPCSTANQPPWISACNRDVAGEILEHFYGPLDSPQVAREDSFFQFDQPQGNSMDQIGVAYVPKACRELNCSVHMALHGCEQGLSRGVGERFFRNVGFNEWAESNDIIVIYPQAISSMGNPNQCWDWWGYLNFDYLTKKAPQIVALKSILDSFTEGSVELKPLQIGLE